MASIFPYTYYTCPCTDITAPSGAFDETPTEDEAAEANRTFDRQSPRANFALHPLENLLFCNECHEIRCPRCYFEEVLYYFCPQCLLETPSTTVKSESNRCTRSCFQCPICIAPLALQSLGASDDLKSKSDQPSMRDGPFVLSCPYCAWSTLEIGIKFEKSINISGQLAKIKNGGEVMTNEVEGAASMRKAKANDQFSNLVNFYKEELPENAPQSSLGLGGSFGLDSPSHLARLLSTYGVGGLKKQRSKPQPMREARDESEGVELDAQNEVEMIHQMRELGWDGTTSLEQRARQANGARFFPDVRPIATPLLSKRAKRCRACRHNLIRPDDKRQSTRYKIRLLALNFIPKASLKAMDPALDHSSLRPLRASQFLLTFRNPLFDPVKVHLATPPTVPSRVSSKVTILCPQFDIGASADVWDEALDAGRKDKRRTQDLTAQDGQQAEAGKVWDKGRNWTTIILEIVPGTAAPKNNTLSEEDDGESLADNDEAILEVPILLRMEYFTDATTASPGFESPETRKTSKDERVARELQYWMVLGLGRITP